MNNRLYGEVVNAGNQKSIRIKDLIKMIQKIMGSNLKVHTKRNRIRKGKSEVNYLHSNSKKFINLPDGNQKNITGGRFN